MIDRYSLPRMSAIWSDENRFRKMLDVELFACEALTKLGEIPKGSLFQIKKHARFEESLASDNNTHVEKDYT